MAGPALQRVETVSIEASSDVFIDIRSRVSDDNGRTWSDWIRRPDNTVKHKGTTFWEGGDTGMPLYDPHANVLIQPWLRQFSTTDGRFLNFSYYRLSRDFGRSWSEPRQFKYEEGADFDPKNPLNPEFLERNQGYVGQKFLRHSNGTAIFVVGHANVWDDRENDRRPWRMGSVSFVGCWNAKKNDYVWKAGKRVAISPELSSRGLMEPDLAELKDGRLLVVWRGSSTAKTPGHKWYSISTDGGLTLSPVAEWKYADGSSFYSPSSFHRLFRHQGNGKLYWIGNISPMAEAATGNGRRYPLVIAEVNETSGQIEKETVMVVADREDGQSAQVQFSNFSLLENPENHQVEIIMSPYFADGTPACDCYKYTLTFR